MEAVSIKFRGQKCFQGDWVGFDQIKPINLIIGRNNSGKSQLLSMLPMFVKPADQDKAWSVRLATDLTESLLKQAFQPNYQGGELGGNHWQYHGRKLVGKPCIWVKELGQPMEVSVDLSGVTRDFHMASTTPYHEVLREYIGKLFPAARSPLANRRLIHIDAERDLQAEVRGSTDPMPTPKGVGGTDFIRRYLIESQKDERLIRETVLAALNRVVQPDAEFADIQVKEIGERKEGPDWEVFLVREGGAGLPLSSLGSGIRSSLLILLVLLLRPKIEEPPRDGGWMFSIEEPELFLHPAMLRRLLREIEAAVKTESHIVFLTTHSSAALDFFAASEDAQLLSVEQKEGVSDVRNLTKPMHHADLVRDLGGRPGDLMLANGVLWVEGPSDRIYLNRLIELFSGEGETLQEGRHYQVACYGGSAGEAVSFDPGEDDTEDLIRLIRLNHNVAVVCDGDRREEDDDLKAFAQRFEEEVDGLGDHAFFWATQPKEIENHLPGEVFRAVRAKKKPSIKASFPDPGRFDRFPAEAKAGDYWHTHAGVQTFDKVSFAREAVKHLTRDNLAGRFDLADRMKELVAVIRGWNG